MTDKAVERLREWVPPHRRGCKINPGGKIMAILGQPEPHPCTCGRDQFIDDRTSVLAALEEKERLCELIRKQRQKALREATTTRGLLEASKPLLDTALQLAEKVAGLEEERDTLKTVLHAAEKALGSPPTDAEIQSGLSRVRFAELLIRQLPEDHDGRNTWLMNYSEEALTLIEESEVEG